MVCEILVDSLHRDPPTPGTVWLILNGKGCFFCNPFPRSKKTKHTRNETMVDVGNFHIGTIEMGCLISFIWTDDGIMVDDLRGDQSPRKCWAIRRSSLCTVLWLGGSPSRSSHRILEPREPRFFQLLSTNLLIHFEVPSPFDSLGTTKSLS